MTLVLPEFAEALHYRELRGSDPESHGIYRFRLIQDVTLQIPHLHDHSAVVSFRDVRRKEWARIDRDRMTIRRGYAWNGASPKRWIPLLGWVGTPDFEPTRLATLFHDVSFQFLHVADWPLPFSSCNDLFFDLMRARGFRMTSIYHGAVHRFGKRFAGDFPKQGEHSVVLHLAES